MSVTEAHFAEAAQAYAELLVLTGRTALPPGFSVV